MRPSVRRQDLVNAPASECSNLFHKNKEAHGYRQETDGLGSHAGRLRVLRLQPAPAPAPARAIIEVTDVL